MEFFYHPKSKSKKRVSAADLAKKSQPDEPIKTDDSFPSDSSLNACFRLARDAGGDAFDVAVRRLSDESLGSCGSRTSSASSAASRVSFVDEEFGLEPRHVVTQTHYRPRTTDGEKRELFYSSRDFEAFERQELCYKIRKERYERRKFKIALLSNQISF